MSLTIVSSKVKTIWLCCAPFHAQRSALLEYLRAAADHAIAVTGFIATVANTSPASNPAPVGMVWVLGGEFWMGSDEPQFLDARPSHRVYVDGF